MSASDETPCQSCGACCTYSADWPRFGLETEAEIEAIPRSFVDDARGTMRCDGDRCAALAGEVGVATACSVYAVRPQVCRACEPGDDSCTLARRHFNLPELAVPAP
ncbi:MAG TPA: YkgJ family cysteine cluster protein [Xanthobacteraceae bacterium]|nr:YkgJ family cysteine cluster protein [Xanthobacteraceae bacterium]